MERPILLLKKELIKPIDQALNRFKTIKLKKNEGLDKIISEGLFVLAIASFENALLDTLRKFFEYIPEKLDIKNETIDKSALIEGNFLRSTIENKINKLGFRKIDEVIEFLTDKMSIASNSISIKQINRLTEIKESRNLLIHNNLKINSFYKDNAGPYIRKADYSMKLEIGEDYLFSSLHLMNEILTIIKTEILNKYDKYTKVRALKTVFNYIFPTPVMKFENEFDVDLEKDCISFIKRDNSQKESLSSSERVLFDIWVAHTHGDSFKFNGGKFYSLDSNSNKKLKLMIDNLDLLKS